MRVGTTMGLAFVVAAESAIKAAIMSGTVKTVDHALSSPAVPWPVRKVALSEGMVGTKRVCDAVNLSLNGRGERAWNKMVRG
jgi:hypothetical protein